MNFVKRYPVLVLVVASAAIAIFGSAYRDLFPFDDTFITFRYAENLANGHGIVWNVGGAHTEGYTNFLFVLLLSICSRMHLDLLASAQLLSVFATVVTSISLFSIIRNALKHSFDTTTIWPAYLGAALFLFDPFIWYNVWSGMETSLFLMFVILTIASMDRWSETESGAVYLQSFLLATLATLVRPEGAMLGAILVVIAFFRRGTPKRAVVSGFLFGFVLPLAIYAGWKYYYFGWLLPNSFYVKVGQPQLKSGTRFRGFGDEWPFLLGISYLFVFSIPVLLLRDLKGYIVAKLSPAVIGTICWVVGLALFYFFPEHMQPNYYRFVISVKAGVEILASIGLYATSMRFRSRWLPYALTLLLLTLHFYSIIRVEHAHAYIKSDHTFDHRYEHIATIFATLPNHENLTIAWADAGKIPYYSHMKNIDVVGLNNNEIAHSTSSDSVLEYVENARPGIIIIPTDSAGRIILWGHGLIGHSYPQLASYALSSGYQSIAQFSQSFYQLVMLVDTTIPEYHGIRTNIESRIGKDSIVLAPPANLSILAQ